MEHFFSGCESWMEVPLPDAPAEDADASVVEAAPEVPKIDQEIAASEMLAVHMAELDRMTAYIGKYGVDRSFLRLCNFNNRLADLYHLTLPASESIEVRGDPRSPASQAALESIREDIRTIWEFIKRMCLRLIDYITAMVTNVEGRCGDIINSYTSLKREIDMAQRDHKVCNKSKELTFKLDLKQDADINKSLSDCLVKLRKYITEDIPALVDDRGKVVERVTEPRVFIDAQLQQRTAKNHNSSSTKTEHTYNTDSVTPAELLALILLAKTGAEKVQKFYQAEKTDWRHCISQIRIQAARAQSEGRDDAAKELRQTATDAAKLFRAMAKQADETLSECSRAIKFAKFWVKNLTDKK